MADGTKIEWTDATWNPVVGCSVTSPGCTNCYAMRQAPRTDALSIGVPLAGPAGKLTKASKAGPVWTGAVRLVERRLDEPLRWRKPRRIFVNSMGDLFHESVSDEWIDRVFAVMALAPQHTFQVLTKRAERMREYASDPETPGRVARAADGIMVSQKIAAMGPERVVPIDGFPGYFVSDRGHVYTDQGSETCLRCGKPMPGGIARRKFCGRKCRQMDAYDRSVGKAAPRPETRRRMTPMPSDQGHMRVMLYREGDTIRELVHRLVLAAFDRGPEEGEQGCHRNGDPTNNALPNLRWGTQSNNWNDRRRHGTGGPSDFIWPLPNCWLGTSVEDQERADERIPHLLATPAATRFISAEPLLGPVDLWNLRGGTYDAITGCGDRERLDEWEPTPALDWVIVGGESGPNARPFNTDWASSIVAQCRSAGIACFVKQLGAHVIQGGEHRIKRDKKGGDLSEWPHELRVREFPQ